MISNVSNILALFELVGNISFADSDSTAYINRVIWSLKKDIYFVEFTSRNISFNPNFNIPVVFSKFSSSSSFLRVIVLNHQNDLKLVFSFQNIQIHIPLSEINILLEFNMIQLFFKDT